jgi:hypothetical protein
MQWANGRSAQAPKALIHVSFAGFSEPHAQVSTFARMDRKKVASPVLG